MTQPSVLYVCTGNAARSVMATVMTRERCSEMTVWGAGTHSIEGLPMSMRTRTAIVPYATPDPEHRSHQLTNADVEAADVIVVFEPGHRAYLQRTNPEALAKAVSLPRLARSIGTVDGTVAERILALDLANQDWESWEEVVDPAGGEQPDFDRSAAEIDGFVNDVLVGLGYAPAVAGSGGD